MMFRIITIVFFFLIISSTQLIAQDEAAPLIERIQNTKGNNKVDLLNEISVVYRKTDRYESMNYSRQAYKLSVETNYNSGKALAKKNEGICWFFIGNNDSATLCYTEALRIYTKIEDKKGMSACYNNIGLIAQETGKYDDAIRFYQRSVEIDHELGDELGAAQTLANIADLHIYRGEFKKAMALTNQSLTIYMKQSYKLGILEGYCNRGTEYNYLSKFNESERDYLKALTLSRELKDKYMEIMVNSNLGVMYWHWGKPEKAMQYLTTALEMSDESDDAYNIDNTLNTIAEIYTSQKKYVEANEIYQKILNRNVEMDNKRKVALIMTAIGRNLIELNEIDKALGYLNKSLEITVGLKTPLESLENYRNLAYASAILHNFKAADSLLDIYADTYTEIYNSDSIVGNRILKIKMEERTLSPFTDTNKWIIAFLLLIAIVMMSVLAFRDKNRDN